MANPSTSVRLAPFDSRLVEIRPDNIDAAIRMANSLRAEKKIDGVNLLGFKSTSLQPLTALSRMERLQLQSCVQVDIGPLYDTQAGLAGLTVTSDPVEIDFSRFSELREFSGIWHRKSAGLDKLKKLVSLALWKLDDRFSDIESLGLSSKLRELWFTQSKIRSLHGVAKLKQLEALELAYLRGPVDLSEIAKAPKLKKVKLESVPQHLHLAALGKCKSLIDIHVEKAGSVETIGWVKGLKKLDSFVILETKVADGDFSAILKLPSLTVFSADHRREYRPSIEELEAIVDARSAS